MNEVAITLDVDWAPDFAIDAAAAVLRDRGVQATWFVTHASEAVDRLREEPDLFELGIHPNFLPGTTHGSTTREVLEHVLEIVPGAVSMRSHSLATATPILHEAASSTSIEVDVTTLLPYHPGIRPVLHSWEGSTLVRLPYYWEEDHEMELDPPGWDPDRLVEAEPGLRVVNFHPIHIVLNSASMDAYRGLGPLAEVTEDEVGAVAETGEGTRTMFEGLADRLSGKDTWRIRDLRDRFPALWPSP